MVKPYNPPQFPPLDLSYWQVKDKEWMAARKTQWSKVEAMLKHDKSSKGMAIIKQYFLKGKLPDWEKLRDWDNYERHLDLFLFLYLHPSTDKNYLIELRDQYIKSLVIIERDIIKGISMFLYHGAMMASGDYSDEEVTQGISIIYTGKNEMYFELLMDVIDEELGFYSYSMVSGEKIERVKIKVNKPDFLLINSMSKWLCIKKMRPFSEDFLYQYDKPLDWWYECRPLNEGYFDEDAQSDTIRKIFKIALYRIYHFDTQKEGDTCRTRFVHKMRKILDERPFIKEFEAMWAQVKSGEIQVEGAFERRPTLLPQT